MKLSEAIRLGAMMGPQVFGVYSKDGGACALGAAAIACGLVPDFKTANTLGEEFPRLLDERRRFACPVCGERDPLGRVIALLNDDHRWTREQIADWVATVELAQDSADAERGRREIVAVPAVQAEIGTT